MGLKIGLCLDSARYGKVELDGLFVNQLKSGVHPARLWSVPSMGPIPTDPKG